ncbi:MAG: protein DA1 [Candidatus Zixiibacteriota bacterium]
MPRIELDRLPTTRLPFWAVLGALTLFFGLIIAVTASTATPQMRCVSCGKPITSGSYIEVDNQFYHAKHFLCANCSKPITTLPAFFKDGKYYDSTCYLTQIGPRCAYCNGPILDSFKIWEGKNYHDSCYFDHAALRCALCGDTIQGKYLEDDWGNSYHSRHNGVAPKCDYCNRFLPLDGTGLGTVYEDGQTLCGECRKTAVERTEDAIALMYALKDSLAAVGIDIDRDKLPLKLVDKHKMAEISHGEHPRTFGYTIFEKTSRVYGLVTTKKFQVYALKGMPLIYLKVALAHELMHVWLGLNAPMYQDDAMVEGSCNYAAYLLLQRWSGDEVGRQAKSMMNDSDPKYGQGFRKIMAYAQSVGTFAWLEYLKSHSDPPW